MTKPKPWTLFSLTCWLSLAVLVGCQPHTLEPYQTERFDLVAAPAAAVGYPMEVAEGRFTTSDGKSFPVSPEFLEGEWALSHSTYVSGDGTAPAPDSLELRWFSYPEDKFYEGRFLLPQKRIYDLLKQGYWNVDKDRHETYDELTLCILPKGLVVVWLSGQNQVLVGRYQGQEIDFDFKQFNSGANRQRMIAQEQAKLPPAVQEQISSGTLSIQPWDSYLKTYPWKISFSQPLKLYRSATSYFNGEIANYAPTRDQAPLNEALLMASPKPAPKSMLLHVEAGYGRKRQLQVTAFDEAEILGAFQTLHAGSAASPLELHFETDERATKARLFLKSGPQQVELLKSAVEVSDAE